jgi:hypothetical protein
MDNCCCQAFGQEYQTIINVVLLWFYGSCNKQIRRCSTFCRFKLVSDRNNCPTKTRTRNHHYSCQQIR